MSRQSRTVFVANAQKSAALRDIGFKCVSLLSRDRCELTNALHDCVSLETLDLLVLCSVIWCPSIARKSALKKLPVELFRVVKDFLFLFSFLPQIGTMDIKLISEVDELKLLKDVVMSSNRDSWQLNVDVFRRVGYKVPMNTFMYLLSASSIDFLDICFDEHVVETNNVEEADLVRDIATNLPSCQSLHTIYLHGTSARTIIMKGNEWQYLMRQLLFTNISMLDIWCIEIPQREDAQVFLSVIRKLRVTHLSLADIKTPHFGTCDVIDAICDIQSLTRLCVYLETLTKDIVDMIRSKLPFLLELRYLGVASDYASNEMLCYLNDVVARCANVHVQSVIVLCSMHGCRRLATNCGIRRLPMELIRMTGEMLGCSHNGKITVRT